MADDTVPEGTFGQDENGPTNANAEEIPSQYEVCMFSGFRSPRANPDFPKDSDLVKQWNGFWVMRKYADIRNPQETRRENTTEGRVPQLRPEQDDEFIETAVTAEDL